MPDAKRSIGVRIGLISELFTACHQPKRIKNPCGNWILSKYDANGNLIEDKPTAAGQVLDRSTPTTTSA